METCRWIIRFRTFEMITLNVLFCFFFLPCTFSHMSVWHIICQA